MANLPNLSHLYVDDVDATTMEALKINDSTHSPQFVTYGDTAPTAIAPWHVHWSSGAGTGNEPMFSQTGVGTDKLLGSRTVTYRWGVPFDGPQLATGTITVTSNPTISGDTIRIGPAANTYRFRTAVDGLAAQNDVLIGANAAETARNLAHAIYAMGAVSGTQFHASTEPHPTVYAEHDGVDKCTIRARQGGSAGNSIQMIFDGTTGDGTFTLSGATLGTDSVAGINRGGGNNLTQGAAYYAMPGGWQLSSSHGYFDDVPRRLINWTYTAPAAPTIQNGGAATATVQIELVHTAGTALYTLTASGATETLGRTQYSNSGGTAQIPASVFIWARVPSAAGASWKAPPGAVWELTFAREKG